MRSDFVFWATDQIKTLMVVLMPNLSRLSDLCCLLCKLPACGELREIFDLNQQNRQLKLRGHSIKGARLGNFLHSNDYGKVLSKCKSCICGGRAKLNEIYVLTKHSRQFATST